MLAAKEKISTRQAVILFLLAVFSPSIRLFPTYSSEIAQTAGWLSPLFAVVPFLILPLLHQSFFKKNSGKNLADIYYEVLGKFLGRVVLFFYLFWLCVLLGLYVRYFAERFLSTIHPDTPMSFFTIAILGVAFVVARGGLVVFTRLTEVFFLGFMALFSITFMLALPDLKFLHLYPVTYYDILPLMKSTYPILGIWGYFTFMMFFADRMNDKENIKRFGLQSAVFLVITCLSILIITIGTLGYNIAGRVSLPYFIAMKNISVMDTLERIESIVLAFWIIVDFVIITLFVLLVAAVIKSLFSLNGTKNFISPVVLVAYLFSFYIAQSRFELEDFSLLFGMNTNIVLCYIIPLIIFGIGKLRKKF